MNDASAAIPAQKGGGQGLDSPLNLPASDWTQTIGRTISVQIGGELNAELERQAARRRP